VAKVVKFHFFHSKLRKLFLLKIKKKINFSGGQCHLSTPVFSNQQNCAFQHIFSKITAKCILEEQILRVLVKR